MADPRHEEAEIAQMQAQAERAASEAREPFERLASGDMAAALDYFEDVYQQAAMFGFEDPLPETDASLATPVVDWAARTVGADTPFTT